MINELDPLNFSTRRGTI